MLTVRDLIDGKGKVQRAFVQITTEDQAAVAEAAGMDIIGTAHKPKNFHLPAAVPNTHFQFGLLFGAHTSAEEAFRQAFQAMEHGAQSIYCAMSPSIVEVLAREGVPVIAHVLMLPWCRPRQPGLAA